MSALSKPSQLLPIGRSMALVVLTFVAIVGGLLWMNNARAEMLSAVRAYVNGEALYSKGQKDAVNYLLRFAQSGRVEDYERFATALAVPLGDRQARLALEQPEPDLQRASDGFIAGRNHPGDVENLAQLFRRFRHVSFMDRAVELWSQGDALVMELRQRGAELQQLLSTEPVDRTRVEAVLGAVKDLNDRLTIVEEDFSRVLGEGNRWVEQRLRQASYAVTAALLLAGIAVSTVILRRVKRTDQALSAQAEQWRVTLASIGDAVIATDILGRISNLNAAALTLTGWSQTEATGQPLEAVFRIVDEQTGAPAVNPVARVLEKGATVALANQVLITKEGTRRPIDDSAAPITDAEGRIVGCVLIFRDIAQRRSLELENTERLAAARLLAAIVASSHDAIISKSLDGTIRSWNRSAERLLGYRAEQAIGRNISLLIPTDRADEEADILARVRRGERVEHFDTIRLRSDGTTIHVSLTISPIRDEAGQVIGASKIMRDISEQKATERRIHDLMTELTDADRRKDEFLAMLSHELRNPLSAIRSAVATASLDDALRPRALEIARRQADQLAGLVDDLLDVARITQGRITLHKQRTDLAQLIERAVDSTRPTINARSLHLDVSRGTEPISVEADPVRLEQVFVNLLSNAAKYTDPGGRIDVRVERRGNEAVVRVRDTGIGIAPDMLPHVWTLFTQAERTLDRAQGGLGIGLTLARRLVELHGGRIEAHSSGIGKGAEFIVFVPVLAPQSAATDNGAAPEPAPASTQAAHILVVEDNADAAESLMMLLQLLGHKVQTMSDGPTALEAARASVPDVMLVDIGLPGIDGYEVARRVRRDPQLDNVLLVALTGYGRDEDKEAAMAAGFDRHLVKPVTPSMIQSLVSKTRIEHAAKEAAAVPGKPARA